jgi:hypothetical protein
MECNPIVAEFQPLRLSLGLMAGAWETWTRMAARGPVGAKRKTQKDGSVPHRFDGKDGWAKKAGLQNLPRGLTTGSTIA